MSIERITKDRKVDFLFHFTRIENLNSILAHGLLTKSQYQTVGIAAVTNDQYRLDGEDATCLSIGFPNYKMFYRLRQEQPERDWAVLAIRPSVLWEKQCAFCTENAASNSVTCVPIAIRKGPQALATLFEDFGDKKRTELGIPDKYPTNPQAEVLVFDVIEPRYIVGVAFNKIAVLQQFKGRYGVQMLHTTRYFKPRSDFTHWGKQDG